MDAVKGKALLRFSQLINDELLQLLFLVFDSLQMLVSSLLQQVQEASFFELLDTLHK